jgi:glutamate dehydrogenase
MRTASLLDVFSMLDIVEIAQATGTPIEDVLRVYYHASERFGIDDMLFRVSQLRGTTGGTRLAAWCLAR